MGVLGKKESPTSCSSLLPATQAAPRSTHLSPDPKGCSRLPICSTSIPTAPLYWGIYLQRFMSTGDLHSLPLLPWAWYLSPATPGAHQGRIWGSRSSSLFSIHASNMCLLPGAVLVMEIKSFKKCPQSYYLQHKLSTAPPPLKCPLTDESENLEGKGTPGSRRPGCKCSPCH